MLSISVTTTPTAFQPSSLPFRPVLLCITKTMFLVFRKEVKVNYLDRDPSITSFCSVSCLGGLQRERR
jgi:hypothetical protein